MSLGTSLFKIYGEVLLNSKNATDGLDFTAKKGEETSLSLEMHLRKSEKPLQRILLLTGLCSSAKNW